MLLAEMTWPEVDALSRDTPVIIPVAAVEQHGHHLPVYTDSMLLGEVVRRVELVTYERVLFAPLQWLGNSHHHLEFKGTLSASPRVYLDLLRDLAENLMMHGFKRIVFLNGHGGNITPGKQAVFELRQEHRTRSDLLLLFMTYWDAAKPNAGRTDLVQSQMGHACEWETSMILRIAPHLVKKDVATLPDVGFGFDFEPAYRGWITADRTVPGHIGQPRAATADKGEYLFDTFAKGLVTFLDTVIAWDGKTWAK
jgi:creatinine amidohydrolase